VFLRKTGFGAPVRLRLLEWLELYCILYGSTKGFVSYGGFTHVGFPLRRFPLPHFIRLVSNYHSPLSLPLPSRRSRVPASAAVLCPARHPLHLPCGFV
jgi:hypothetical protein